MKKFLLLTLTFIGTIMLTACGGQSSNSQSISVVGSTSVAPIAEALAEKYQEGIVDIQSVGSSAGIKAAADGTADIGMSSRDLKAEEKSGLKEYKIALDGIAVVVNSKNTAKDLTVEQLQKIYKGEIT
ncbi:MAG: substrate-binding domain-containing protein, partial [Fusobacteria bacterium]|nr:substrate-binding domain-containing protein [Fusobacteriota bacterium]